MKINKNEYENIEIPEQLDSVVQDAIDEGLQKRGRWRTSSVWKCIISVAAAACLIVVVLLNTSPLFAETIKDMPIVGHCARYLHSAVMSMRMSQSILM